MDTLKSLTAGWGVPVPAARRCYSCKTAAAAAFCKADAAFLCLNCDTKIHGTNRLVSRVWMCEVCEQAPAAVTCKADAAALCVTCDSDIHSANPLARRHERVPIQPFFDSADSIIKTSPFNFLVPDADSAAGGFHHHEQHQPAIDDDDDMNEVSWLLPNLNSTSLNSKISNMENHHHEMKPGTDLFFNGMEDPFIDIHEFHQQQNHDSVVPEQQTKSLIQPPPTTIPVIAAGESCYDIDFCRSKLSSFNYPCQSISQSVSSSSLRCRCSSLMETHYPIYRTPLAKHE